MRDFVEEAAGREEEKYDNMCESFGDNCAQVQKLEEVWQALEEAYSQIDEAHTGIEQAIQTLEGAVE